MNKDGGAAFPRPIGEWGDTNGQYNSPQDGMTMRQWYKGMALQGLLACSTVALTGNSEFATAAGDLADAMLAEDAARGKEEK